MSHRSFLPALFALAAVTAAPATAQGVAGTWQISTETQRGTQSQTLVLEVDGAALTGTLTFGGGGRRGGGRGPGTVEIEDGTVTGDSFAFNISLEFNGNSITQAFTGEVDGDTISGTRTGSRGGGAPFTGTRSD